MPSHCRMRLVDRDLIRGGHYGQRSCEPHQKAEHMAAPTNAAKREESSCQPGAVHTWHKLCFAISAIRSRTGAKRTWRGQPNSVEIDQESLNRKDSSAPCRAPRPTRGDAGHASVAPSARARSRRRIRDGDCEFGRCRIVLHVLHVRRGAIRRKRSISASDARRPIIDNSIGRSDCFARAPISMHITPHRRVPSTSQ